MFFIEKRQLTQSILCDTVSTTKQILKGDDEDGGVLRDSESRRQVRAGRSEPKRPSLPSRDPNAGRCKGKPQVSRRSP